MVILNWWQPDFKYQLLPQRFDPKCYPLLDSTISLPEGLPEYLHPALRIFLSVDIVNSTAFKQANPSSITSKKGASSATEAHLDKEEPWFSPITGFYRGIERKLSEEWAKTQEDVQTLQKQDGESPTLWKASGDEVIYVKKLTDPFQALLAVRTWMASVNRHRDEIKGHFHALDLKAAAWLSGFPVNNAEVAMQRKPEGASVQLRDPIADDPLLVNFRRLKLLHENGSDDDGNLFRDFIGPSMDTGFRVASLASPRKFALTIDLAYMLACAGEQIPQHLQLTSIKSLSFQYDGRVHLKGVSGGAPYPFFWVDMKVDDPLLNEEDELLNRRRLKCTDVSSFCTQFFANKEDRGPFMTPYITSQPQTSPFSHFPDAHRSRLSALAYWSKELIKREEEQNSQLDAAKASIKPDLDKDATPINIDRLFSSTEDSH
jgi:hypothetical protein